jgi:hypothetical protein
MGLKMKNIKWKLLKLLRRKSKLPPQNTLEKPHSNSVIAVSSRLSDIFVHIPIAPSHVINKKRRRNEDKRKHKKVEAKMIYILN